MNEYSTPALFQDAQQLLTAQGFTTSTTWYHGTASGLVDSITSVGLVGSGDLETLQKHLETLGTIGHDHSAHKDPLFITQSKELAYYWALKKAHIRSRFHQQHETPVVFELQLSEELAAQVTTDAGGAALILEPGNQYLQLLNEIYQEAGLTLETLDPFTCDRLDYLNKLGLAYLNAPVPADSLRVLSA